MRVCQALTSVLAALASIAVFAAPASAAYARRTCAPPVTPVPYVSSLTITAIYPAGHTSALGVAATPNPGR